MSPALPDLPIIGAHVARQFARRGDLESAQFLYGEIGRRMLERLRYIKVQPVQLLDAGCGAGASLPLLRERYPNAGYIGLDICAPLLEIARERHTPRNQGSLLSRLAARLGRNTGKGPEGPRRGGNADAGPPQGGMAPLGGRKGPEGPHREGNTHANAGAIQFIHADLADTGLPPESLELVWSNLALHWHPRPHAALAEWRRILKVNGLAMFSCLGPGTLRELRQAVADAGLSTATPSFVDMHDFGDLLVENGFADPVMDQETLTLTYQTPDRLLEDVRALGGNPAAQRKRSLTTPAWRDRLCQALEAQRRADGTIALTIEVAYGHAWRAAARRVTPGETRLSISAIGGRHGPAG